MFVRPVVNVRYACAGVGRLNVNMWQPLLDCLEWSDVWGRTKMLEKSSIPHQDWSGPSVDAGLFRLDEKMMFQSAAYDDSFWWLTRRDMTYSTFALVGERVHIDHSSGFSRLRGITEEHTTAVYHTFLHPSPHFLNASAPGHNKSNPQARSSDPTSKKTGNCDMAAVLIDHDGAFGSW